MPVDHYRTPVGMQPGMFIHANYAEALISNRVYRLAPSPWVTSIESVSLLILGIGVVVTELATTRLLLVALTI